MAIKRPEDQKNALPLPMPAMERPTFHSVVVDVSGQTAATNDIIRITGRPNFQASGARFVIDRLNVGYSAGVQQDTTTQVVICKESDNTVIMAAGLAAHASNAGFLADLQNKNDQTPGVSDAGLELCFREIVPFWIGLRYPTAKSAAIGANKSVRVYLSYRAV